MAAEYLDRLAGRAANLPVGDPHRAQGALRPLISERQLQNVDRIVTAAVQAGAEVRAGATYQQLVHVNDQTLNNDAYAPFRGTGASGNGSRFGSQSSWDEFTQWQRLTLRDQAHGFPF